MLPNILFLITDISRPSYLLMNAFVFVIISVIWARTGTTAKKFSHFILVEPHIAGVAVGIFVIFIEFAALAAGLRLVSVLGKIHFALSLAPAPISKVSLENGVIIILEKRLIINLEKRLITNKNQYKNFLLKKLAL